MVFSCRACTHAHLPCIHVVSCQSHICVQHLTQSPLFVSHSLRCSHALFPFVLTCSFLCTLYRTLILGTTCFKNLQFLSLNNSWGYLSVLKCISCSSHLYFLDCFSNYFLQARYPVGIALDAVFVHPSVVDMLDTAVGDAIENGHWYC